MAGFVKIYQTILDSSIWAEDHAVRIVWVTMLAMADQFGKVEASRGGLARRAQVTDAELDRALSVLSSPDPDDKSKVNEGRRIEEVERGWFIANHAYYRDLRTGEQIKTAERVRRFREKTHVTGTEVTPCNDAKRSVRTDQKQIRSEAEAKEDPEGEKEREAPPAPARKRAPPGTKRVPPEWQPKLELSALAREHGVSLDLELAKFRDHQFARAHSDWDAAARNWIRNARPTATSHGKPTGLNPAMEKLRREAMGQ